MTKAAPFVGVAFVFSADSEWRLRVFLCGARLTYARPAAEIKI